MVSIDLKDAYLQIPIHPDSRKCLRFVALNQVFQFKTLCFGLSTAPQVFTRVMAPVSVLLHRLGVRMCQYLDDWLILASSRPLVLQALETVLHLCQELGILVNWEKSQLTPSQRVVYLGVILNSTLFRASLSQPRVEKLCLTVEEFLSSLWRRLLGILSSPISIVPGGRLRMRSLQLRLHLLWDQMDDSTLIPWDLEWWVTLDRLQSGISPAQVIPHLDSWSYASGVGWGAHLQDVTASDLWSPEEALLPINARELLAMEFGLHRFQHLVSNSMVAVLADNSTALSYLRKRGHSISTPQLDCAEDPPLGEVGRLDLGASVYPRHVQCSSGLLVSSESSLEWTKVAGISGAEPQVAGDDRSFCHLVESPLFTIFRPSTIGTDALLQNWDEYQVYAFPPWSMIPQVLKKPRSSSGVLMTLVAPFWPQRPWFLNLLELVVDDPIALPQCRDLLSQPRFHCHHLGMDKLSRHAWRLSNDLLDPRGSPLD